MIRCPALVATDLDGTLLRSDGTVSSRTIDTVRRLQAAGIVFVVATARPPRWLHGLGSIIGDHGLAVCANGAYVYHVARRAILTERTIDRDIVLAIARDLRAALPGITFAVERSDGYGQEAGFPNLHEIPVGSPIASLENLLDFPPGKLLARDVSLPERFFHAEVSRIIGERAIASHSGDGGLAEINAAGVTKAAALAVWCEELGISAGDVWAFGDMPNDIAMLNWAGTSFAVDNAHPLVAAQARYRCPSNDNDGVAQILEQMLTGAGSADFT